MIKVFISHQSQDARAAKLIAGHLKFTHDIDSYLDVIDPFIGGTGEALADHLREEMGKCTQLLAVVSGQTKSSQWVPWEIGVATEKEFPLATYSTDGMKPPEFLQKWPYLISFEDLDSYARASRSASQTFSRTKTASLSESFARTTATREFYQNIRRSLGQRS